MEFVSNTPFTDNEFTKWREAVMLGGMSLPTTKEVEAKQKSISDCINYKLGEKDINHIIKEKERFRLNPRNYAMYKSRLQKDMEIASQGGNEEEAERLKKRLEEIEERAEELDKKRSGKISSIALINDRNRKKNIQKAEEAIAQEMERKRVEGETNDPFTRRKTMPKLLNKEKNPPPTVMTSQLLAELTMMAETGENEKKEEEGAEEEEEQKKKEPEKRKGVDKKELTPEDLFSAHNFDIKIDLEVSSLSIVIYGRPLFYLSIIDLFNRSYGEQFIGTLHCRYV